MSVLKEKVRVSWEVRFEQANDEVKESIRFHIMKFRDWKVP